MGFCTPKERDVIKSLPPAARRKLFSNAELLRLAQGDCCHGLDHQPNLAKLPYREFQLLWDRPCLPASDKSIHKKGPLKKVLYPGTSKNPHHTSMPQAAFLAACPDWHCFHSLPPKIQQSCFSNEERNRLHQICCTDEVFDAADEALFRLGKRRRMSELTETSAISQSSTLRFGTSDVDLYNDMDHTRSACTGRLDEDEDLDLAIEYHAHVMDSPSGSPTRRSLSFRRILTEYSSNSGFGPLSTVHSSPNPSQSSAASEADMTTPTLDSEPHPPQSQLHHNSRSSTSSIDPSAQHYQDPEARLKLRVYLASPQKFDEAVEFGFPTWKRERLNPVREIAQPKIQNPDDRTFFEEGTAFSGVESRKEQNSPRASTSTRYSQSQQTILPLNNNNNRRQWLLSSDNSHRRSPGNREMTLKMTLTRPDLRTDSAIPESTGLSPGNLDPLIWDSGMNERGLVRKIWRTLRRRNY